MFIGDFTYLLFLFMPTLKIIPHNIIMFRLKMFNLFHFVQIFKMKFGYVFELLNVFKDKLIGSYDWFHDLFLHLLLPIVWSHYGLQILRLWLFRELLLTIIDDRQDINIRTYPLMIPTNPNNTPTNNILKQHRKIFSSRLQKQGLFLKIKC